MKYAIAFLAGFLLIVLDCGFLPKIFGVAFSLAYAWCVAFGMEDSPINGTYCAAFCGLMMDILVGPRVGYYAVTYLIAVFATTSIYRRLFQDSILFIGVTACVGYLLMGLLQYLIAFILGARTENIFLIMLRFVLPSALVTGALTVPVYVLMSIAFRKGRFHRNTRGGF